MNVPRILITLCCLLLVVQLPVFAQSAESERQTLQQANPFGRLEVPDSKEQRRFIEEHSFSNRSSNQELGEEAAAPTAQGSIQVRVIYLVPSDKSVSAAYRDAIAGAISNLQVFYRSQMSGGLTFSLHSPAVEVYQTPHPTAYYTTGANARAGGFYESAMADGFALTGGGFNDPYNRWIFYIDADLNCGQYTGGTSGIALLPANDLRGLTNQMTVPTCSNEQAGVLGVNRWIGGLGHELGHAFNLPHPPGCDSGLCTGGTYAANSLMYFGYLYYPSTYFLAEDKTLLLAGGFFHNLSLDSAAQYQISGRISRSDNTPIAGATLTLGETQATVISGADGSFSFTSLPSGGDYTVSVTRGGYRFTQTAVLFNNLDRNQTVNFTGVPLTYRISGQVTLNSSGPGGVTITLSGAQTGAVTTDASGSYSFTVPADGNYTVTPSKAGWVFTPASKSFDNLSANQAQNFAGATAPPVLLTEEQSELALALDSVTQRRGPFAMTDALNFSPDGLTRVSLFAWNLELLPGEDISAVKVQATDEHGINYTLPVESVTVVPGFNWLTQVIVKLPGEIPAPADLRVGITLRGATSNKALIKTVAP